MLDVSLHVVRSAVETSGSRDSEPSEHVVTAQRIQVSCHSAAFQRRQSGTNALCRADQSRQRPGDRLTKLLSAQVTGPPAPTARGAGQSSVRSTRRSVVLPRSCWSEVDGHGVDGILAACLPIWPGRQIRNLARAPVTQDAGVCRAAEVSYIGAESWRAALVVQHNDQMRFKPEHSLVVVVAPAQDFLHKRAGAGQQL